MSGYLPWFDIYNDGWKRNERIKEMNIITSLDEICFGCPEEVKTFIEYSRNLRFEEKPDFDYLSKLLKQILNKNQPSC